MPADGLSAAPAPVRVSPAWLAKHLQGLKNKQTNKNHKFCFLFVCFLVCKCGFPPMQPAPGSVPGGFVPQPQRRELPCSHQTCPISTSQQHESCLQPEPLPWLLQGSAWEQQAPAAPQDKAHGPEKHSSSRAPGWTSPISPLPRHHPPGAAAHPRLPVPAPI